jgi:hypothetical protein
MEHGSDILVLVFAALSAVFAGLCFWVLWLQYRDQCPRLKITLTAEESGSRFFCRAQNTGSRSLFLESFFFSTRDKYAIFYPEEAPVYARPCPSFPQLLKEGMFVEVVFDLPALVSDFRKGKAIPRYFCFQDVRQKIYRYKIDPKSWAQIVEKTER